MSIKEGYAFIHIAHQNVMQNTKCRVLVVVITVIK